MPAASAASRSASRQSNSGKIVPSQGNLESIAFRRPDPGWRGSAHPRISTAISQVASAGGLVLHANQGQVAQAYFASGEYRSTVERVRDNTRFVGQG